VAKSTPQLGVVAHAFNPALGTSAR
jgi:hypothetical protein